LPTFGKSVLTRKLKEASMAMTDAQVKELAAQLVAARTSGKPLATAAAAGLPTNDNDAYRVQDAVMAKLGRRAAGWKVGAANPTSEPNCAPIFDGLIHQAAAGAPGAASTGIELEIAFTLARGFPASQTKPSRTDVEAAIGAANIVLETCVARLAEGMDAPALLRLADNGINHGLVIGPRVENWRTIESKLLVARVDAGGRVIAETTGGHTSPDLIGLLTWLVGHCVTQRGGIPAGTIVTTGSWMGIRFVDTPVEVRGDFPGLGHMSTKVG
jgi:2-keto-4-pentenoate hydratase